MKPFKLDQFRAKLNFGVILISLIVSSGLSASSATITVNTTADENGTGVNCSLREAVQSANTDAAFGGCSAV